MTSLSRSLAVLVPALAIAIATLGGCLWGETGSNYTVTQCRALEVGKKAGSHQGAWIDRWESRYADYRGRYICEIQTVTDDVIDNLELVYQYSCVAGHCSCEAGSTYLTTPSQTASFTATASEAFAAASRHCAFNDSITAAGPRPPGPGLYTLAGNGQASARDGGLHEATVASPLAVADDGQGAVFVASAASHRLRVIVGGQVKTVGAQTKGYADGTLAWAGLQGVRAMTSDSAGKVYLADDLRIRVIKAGNVTTVAGDGTKGCKDGPALAATFGKPVALALAGTALYIADHGCNSIRVLENDVVSTVAGNPKGKVHTGPVDQVRFISVKDVAVDGTGAVYVLGQNNIKVIDGGIVSDLPLGTSQIYDVRRLSTSHEGDLLVLTTNGTLKLQGGTLGKSTSLPGLQDPRAVWVNTAGHLLIADRGGHKVFIYLQ